MLPDAAPPEVALPEPAPPEVALVFPVPGVWEPHATITTATANDTVPRRTPTTGARAPSDERANVALELFMVFMSAATPLDHPPFVPNGEGDLWTFERPPG